MPSGPAAIVLAALALQAPCLAEGCPQPGELVDPAPGEAALAPALDRVPDPAPGPDLADEAPTTERLLDAALPARDARLVPTAGPAPDAPDAPDDRSPEPAREEAPDDREPVVAREPAPAEPPTVAGEATTVREPAPASSARVAGTPIEDEDPARVVAALALGLAAVGLYQRLTKDRLLEHETRQRLLALLEEAPGLTTSELADRLDVGYRTARHHATKLARFDLVTRVDREGPERWALPDDAPEAARRPPEELAGALALVAEAEGVHLSEVARRLGVAKATAKHRLDRLAERGWVEDERVGPLRRFEATPEGRARLADAD